MSRPIAELIMPKVLKVQMSENDILLDIEDVVSGWETYTFSIDTTQPRQQVRFLHLFCPFWSTLL